MSETKERPADGSGTPVWKWLVIGLVTALVVTLVAVYPSLWSPSEGPAGVKEFRSLTEDFTVSYPKDWVKLSASELKKFEETFIFAIKSEEPDAILGVRVQQLEAGEAKLSEVSELLEETLAERFEGFEKISASTIRIDSGEEALRYEYKFLAKGKVPVHQQILIVPADKDVYYVTAWAGEEEYGEVRAELERMIDTFRLN